VSSGTFLAKIIGPLWSGDAEFQVFRLSFQVFYTLEKQYWDFQCHNVPAARRNGSTGELIPRSFSEIERKKEGQEKEASFE